MRPALVVAAAALAVGCSEDGSFVGIGGESDHSSSLAVSADGSTLFVVNPDADSVSILDSRTGALLHEILLAPAPPAVDAGGHYYPAVEPRALALGPGQTTLYVTGHASGRVYAVDVATGTRLGDAAACSEPVGVLVSPDGATVYVACSQDSKILSLAASSLAVTAEAPCHAKPWTLAWSPDRTRLYATHLLGPGISALTLSPLAVSTVLALPDGPPVPGSPTEPHGPVRGIYDVLARPGSTEMWSASIMLGTDTAEPTLLFNMTAFPAISVFAGTGQELARLSVSTAPGDGEAFGDVTSSPRSLAFSADGSLAFVADDGSEDVLVIDAATRAEATLVRPLPGHQPEGIVATADGRVFVHERNTSDVAVLTVASGPLGPEVTPAGTMRTVTVDPMPAQVRLGQHLFYTADSDELPITTDHWISCSTCHIEGRTDAVTWRFLEGPRDTPSNAGGVSQTGFLFRTAARNSVSDYWQTIDQEQGGHFSMSVPELADDMKAIEQYVNTAIPYPAPPSGLDPQQVAAGQLLFTSLGCPGCHAGASFTDSGAGNPTLALGGPVVSAATPGGVLLHDVGTCVTGGPFDDAAMPDEDGNPRDACAFDTPTLRGIADTAPYLHDGRAATLEDVFRLAPGMVGPAATQLSPEEIETLVTYLRSL